ncbi:MAG: hypothetical protein PHQ86_03205 [Dehalococcoidales bacterium]|nr:hypothetical protein [Dehalococcoidales bacterium]
MPNKPQRGKKKRNKRNSSNIVAQKQKNNPIDNSIAPREAVASKINVPDKVAVIPPVKNPYVLRELGRISLVAGVIMIILIVLAFVL